MAEKTETKAEPEAKEEPKEEPTKPTGEEGKEGGTVAERLDRLEARLAEVMDRPLGRGTRRDEQAGMAQQIRDEVARLRADEKHDSERAELVRKIEGMEERLKAETQPVKLSKWYKALVG